jgi:hypothetical protein
MDMFKRYLFIMATVPMVFLSLLLPLSDAQDNVAPEVMLTNPRNGAQNVDPSMREISVTFSERMMDKSWSWCYEERDRFPQMTGQPYYTENNTKNVLPVKLKPHTEYVIWINTVNFKNFRDEAGNPAGPYRFTFKTR